MNERMLLKFYANLYQVYENRLFTFIVRDETAAMNMLIHFIKQGNVIKAAFIEVQYLSPNLETWLRKDNFKLSPQVLANLNF